MKFLGKDLGQIDQELGIDRNNMPVQASVNGVPTNEMFIDGMLVESGTTRNQGKTRTWWQRIFS